MTDSHSSRPAVGVGIIVVRQDGKVLFGKRRNSHAPFWSIPGGHLELGESFEQGACRELTEETGLVYKHVEVIGLTNNLETYVNEHVHTISVITVARYNGSEIHNREPDKCEGWDWFDPRQLPQPHFEASRKAIALWLAKRFY